MAINVQPDQYVLGKGRVYLGLYNTAGALSGGFRFLGNCPAFSISQSNDTLTHQRSTGGLNFTDRDIVISSAVSLSFSCDNMSQENKALWMGGTVDTVTNTSMTAQTDTIIGAKGYAFPVGETAVLPEGVKDITVTSVVNGATTLVAGVDYTVNGRTGMIAFEPGGAAVDGTVYTVLYNRAASSRDVVNDRARSIIGALKFISDNPETGAGKVDEEHYIPKVRISADGDWALIGDTWQQFSFTGTVLQTYDTAGNPLPARRITPLTAPA